MVSYREAKKYLGQMVRAECAGGKYHVGKVKKLSKEGLWLEQQGARQTAGEANIDAVTADQVGGVAAEQVFFLPLLFLPFVTLFALAAYRFGPYGYGYGYPGYGVGPYGYRRGKAIRRGVYRPGPFYW